MIATLEYSDGEILTGKLWILGLSIEIWNLIYDNK